MRCLTWFGSVPASLLLFLVSTSAFAQATGDSSEGDELQAVASFLEQHVINRTLEKRINTKITGGQIETEFHARDKYMNLVRTPYALRFDVLWLVAQTNFDLDDQGQRLDKPPHVQDRSGVTRYTLKKSKSTGKLVGTTALLTTSVKDSVEGLGAALQAFVENGRLTIIATTPLYSDYFAPGGKFKPGAGRTVSEFYVEDGKLRQKTRELGFDVDPETLERKPSGHDIVLESHEVPSLF